MTKIIRNAAGCLLCGDAIESETTHDMKWCRCGNIAVDGGKTYLKRSIKFIGLNPSYIDLSQTE